MAFKASDLFTPGGTIDRGPYVIVGVVLFALKHNIDRIVASAVFHRQWGLFNYWIPGDASSVQGLGSSKVSFFLTLIALALPFIWIGVVLTLKRLRAIGWPTLMVVIFFMPFVNLLFFLLVALIPTRPELSGAPRTDRFKRFLNRLIPDSAIGSAAMGVFVTVPFSVGITLISVRSVGGYGWGLFIGLPFCLGLISVLIYGFHKSRPLGMCLCVAMLSVVLAGLALVALAIEGVVCLIMAAPIGLVLALLGGLTGYAIQRRSEFQAEALHASAIVLLGLPLVLALEQSVRSEPEMFEVRSSVVIHAPREMVWNNLVAFAELPQPTERLFKTGVAYPLRAEIDGKGVGAIRNCVFTTGAFVEPIEVWDEPRLLRFGVRSQPPVMQETSPYSNLRPPHLDGYLRSRQGQFLLTDLGDGSTRLEGTTWYQNKFWPSAYWRLWSDYVIHRIHMRVLEHIKTQAER